LRAFVLKDVNEEQREKEIKVLLNENAFRIWLGAFRV
jgi:hypothetical protein